VTLEPGRILMVDLSSLAGLRPVAAVVEVIDGTMVPAQESISSEGYAVSTGIPFPGLLSR
jgi:3,4-dihydroxy-2-butanone 4-phosphate synthase